MFKKLETEEEVRAAFSAGILWYCYRFEEAIHKPECGDEWDGADAYVRAWRGRGSDWDTYVYLED